MKIFKLLFIVFGFLLSCEKEEKKIRPLSFFSEEFTFGPKKEGDSMITYFKFKVNKDNTEITKTSSDCGCSKLKIKDEKVYNMNDIDSIKVIYDSSIKGRFVRRVYAETNIEDDIYTLYIKGEVLD